MEYGPDYNGSLIARAKPHGRGPSYRINCDFERASSWPKSLPITRRSRGRGCTTTTTSAPRATTLRATTVVAARAVTRFVTTASDCSVSIALWGVAPAAPQNAERTSD